MKKPMASREPSLCFESFVVVGQFTVPRTPQPRSLEPELEPPWSGWASGFEIGNETRKVHIAACYLRDVPSWDDSASRRALAETDGL